METPITIDSKHRSPGLQTPLPAELQAFEGLLLRFRHAVDDHLEIVVDRSKLLEVLRLAKEDPRLGCDLLADVCGVDYLGRDDRFEVVYHLAALSTGLRLRVRLLLKEDDLSVPSAIGIWPAADWFEREAWDLFGIHFEGHPNLKRLLTHEAFDGHPLRKDYDPQRRCILTEDQIMTPDWVSASPPGSDQFEKQVLNLGPSHPATHGTLRTVMQLEGEVIRRAECEIGYLHRCFEKMVEDQGWNQVIPFTDRLNYCSSMINGVGYVLGVEKLLEVEAPPRAQSVRLILSEFSRIMDHAVCLGANLVDLGALTNFWYFFQPREEIYGLLESCCGGRLTVSYARVGGLSHDVPSDFEQRCRTLLESIPRFIDDVDKIVTRNRIFRDRTEGVGVISGADALAWGWTGPCLRASGIAYDVRKDAPYLGYENIEFDVPVATGGDCYARYLVRMEEMRQSLRIIAQALDDLPVGPVMVQNPRIALPEKAKAYGEMESMIRHFKLLFDGIQVPKGSSYSFTEGANGELGYFIVSEGGGRPYRIKVRPPCFAIYQAYADLIRGHMIPDAIAILGSLNIIAGELDR